KKTKYEAKDSYTQSLHDALPILEEKQRKQDVNVKETQDNQKDAKQPKLENREPELIIDMKEAIDIALKEYPGKVKEAELDEEDGDRKSTRLNSSHVSISYAVYCL